MVRNYIRKTNRASYSDTAVHAAMKFLTDGHSLREAEKKFGINYRTLSRYLKVKKSKQNFTVRYGMPGKILPANLEENLTEYAKKASKIFYGITYFDLRQLAYRLAVAHNVRVPESWTTKELAGENWLKSFMKRRTDLSLRMPRATFIQRMANFNPHNVNIFMDNLQEVLNRHNYGPSEIWIVNETGLTTVQTTQKVVAEKGSKHVGSAVSQERGKLVTLCCAANALGNTIPPFFVFPRVKTQQSWLLTAPPESIATGHKSQTGWQNIDTFLMWMQHFVKYAKPSAIQPLLLILDNCSSHVDLSVIDFAKEHHITLLSFPPHCSHRLHPLDVSVFGPLKTYKNQKMDSWMRKNPGRSMSIHVIPSIVSYAYPLAFTPSNIVAEFRKTGIYPFDRNAITPDEYLQNYATFRPFSSEEIIQPQDAATMQNNSNSNIQTDIASRLVQQDIPTAPHEKQSLDDDDPSCLDISTESIRPLGHLENRPSTSRPRFKAKSAIFTDTPVKNWLLQKKIKLSKRCVPVVTRKRKIQFHSKTQVMAKKLSTNDSDSCDDDIPLAAMCDDESDVSAEQSDNSEVSSFSKQLQTSDVKVDDYILVRFTTKSTENFYIGQVMEVDKKEKEIHTFMTRMKFRTKGNTFRFPDVEDTATHGIEDVIFLLPQPKCGTTLRSAEQFKFDCERLQHYNVE